MRKSKIITALIILTVIFVAVVFFVLGNKKSVLAPENVGVINKLEKEREKECQIFGAKENLTEISITPCAALVRVEMITGKLKGGYFFEGSAPLRLEDKNGNIILNTHIDATSEWMTSSDVSFTFTLDTSTIDTSKLPPGMPLNMVIEKSDASGEGKNLMPISIPVYIM